eukprot:CAMPEP_0185170998 /NCGR_PEP_ID=MMETSP1139-20130426/19548_1 /TAXON_ID=298111 /ORGANISM="Pavlova sp., Strain CCMP459" /LENGTH=103 /DNA_ID=CAMNT_0027736595 /DNA_START=399 /DNA_END=706 /DNA_ORIENTATION=-
MTRAVDERRRFRLCSFRRPVQRAPGAHAPAENEHDGAHRDRCPLHRKAEDEDNNAGDEQSNKNRIARVDRGHALVAPRELRQSRRPPCGRGLLIHLVILLGRL